MAQDPGSMHPSYLRVRSLASNQPLRTFTVTLRLNGDEGNVATIAVAKYYAMLAMLTARMSICSCTGGHAEPCVAEDAILPAPRTTRHPYAPSTVAGFAPGLSHSPSTARGRTSRRALLASVKFLSSSFVSSDYDFRLVGGAPGWPHLSTLLLDSL
ncbi:hypothetical protein C8Q70DRAFT_934030 [Cubamyces menziesii]|nr:hypothetical protein C8Q70DRAFT_934030 [Cubamyces menziesii]